MEYKLNTRRQALCNIYNQMFQDLINNEFNLLLLQKEKMLATTLNPQLTTNMNQLRQLIEKIKYSLSMLLQLISDEEKKEQGNKEEERKN